MFTPVGFIFLIVIVLGVYFVVKMKNKNDRKDRDVQQGTGSTSVRRNEAQ